VESRHGGVDHLARSVFGCGTFLPYGIAATNISSGRMSNPTGQLIQASFQSA